MDSLSCLFDSNVGKKIILWDLDNRRYEGVIERVFADFLQIFETKQHATKVFRFSAIKNFSIEGESS